LPDLQRTGLLQANLADTLREKKLIATDGLIYTRYLQTGSAPDFFSLYQPQGDQFYITTSSNTR